MARCDKLFSKAQRAPAALRFSELCALAECWGYEFREQRGSHRKYKHEHLRLPIPHALQVFQNDKGKAKPYQVRQLLDAIAYTSEHHSPY